MDPRTLTWWSVLCAVAMFNIAAWAGSAWWLRRGGAGAATAERSLRRWQLWLSAGYVAGCAWRSVWPVYDVPRLCLVDGWTCSVALGRSVATVAELCFAAQWALLLGAVAREAGSRTAALGARGVLPLIGLAELFSWNAVLTTDNLGHVVEESLWGGCALLVAAGLWRGGRRLAAPARGFALACAAAALGYAAYMFTVDVPMYWMRWLSDEAAGRRYLDLATGFADAAGRWTVSQRWSDWRSEVVWMTLYFSVAVWASIGLAHAPAWRRRTA